ncbi:YezD family protein [Singulisphaera sp. Ch08]|uniref:YezD family protein n=1 Tax=Singulisphaera sp. Ch08 TaxID=3120278 RepID=A0AAU7C7J8_9BACT
MANESSFLPHADRSFRSPPAGISDLDHVRRAITGIRFGTVRVVIQDGVIVQIERMERQRLR